MASSAGRGPCDYDVVVVGAGLAGLQAAVALQRAGLTCLVLEARDRVGGKTLSLRTPRTGHATTELGAAWINDTNQSRMWELAQELRLDTFVQNTVGDVVLQDLDGGLVKFRYGEVPQFASAADTDACVRIRDHVEALSTATSPSVFEQGPLRQRLDGMSFAEFLHECGVDGRAFATAQVWTHAMVGCDPSEVSALYFVEYCAAGGGLMTMRSDRRDGGQYLRIKQGTLAFSEGLAGMLTPGTVRLSSPVKAITQTENGAVKVTVSTEGASKGSSFIARKVIVSIPTPVYKTIKFAPPLPSAKTAVANRTRYGFYTKYMMCFTEPFWIAKDSCGLAQSFVGPVSVFRDTSSSDGSTYALTCFLGGQFGRKWAAQSPEEKKTSILKQIGDIFADGQDVSRYFVESFESPWMEEEYSGWGCPCPVMPPGVLGGGWDALCAPSGNVHFVGTELSTIWRGYMEGAIRSGDRGAAEVIADLQSAKARL